MKDRLAKGKQAEKAAAEYLSSAGYQIVATNWRCKGGEIDIVAQHGETLVFVEVRSRFRTEDAFASVQSSKQVKMLRAAHEYLAETGQEEAAWRIDVIAVGHGHDGKPQIEHVEDALDW
jgi:putative endonuclease